MDFNCFGAESPYLPNVCSSDVNSLATSSPFKTGFFSANASSFFHSSIVVQLPSTSFRSRLSWPKKWARPIPLPLTMEKAKSARRTEAYQNGQLLRMKVTQNGTSKSTTEFVIALPVPMENKQHFGNKHQHGIGTSANYSPLFSPNLAQSESDAANLSHNAEHTLPFVTQQSITSAQLLGGERGDDDSSDICSSPVINSQRDSNCGGDGSAADQFHGCCLCPERLLVEGFDQEETIGAESVGMDEVLVTEIGTFGQKGVISPMKLDPQEINDSMNSAKLAIDEDDLPDDRTMMQMEGLNMATNAAERASKWKTDKRNRGGGRNSQMEDQVKAEVAKVKRHSTKSKSQKRNSKDEQTQQKKARRKEHCAGGEKPIREATAKKVIINEAMGRVVTRQQTMFAKREQTTADHPKRLTLPTPSLSSTSSDDLLQQFGFRIVLIQPSVFNLSDAGIFAMLKRIGNEQKMSLEEKSGSFLFTPTEWSGQHGGDLLALTHNPDHIRVRTPQNNSRMLCETASKAISKIEKPIAIGGRQNFDCVFALLKVDEFRAGHWVADTLERWPRTTEALPLFLKHLHRRLCTFLL